MRLLLIDNHDSFTFNIVNSLQKVSTSDFQVINYSDLNINHLNSFTHFVISPGPMTPADFPLLNKVIQHSVNKQKALLGICLGHQAVCTHFGGKLNQLKKVVHGQKKQIKIREKSILFNNLPQSIEVGLYYSWTVSHLNFPDSLKITAQSNNFIMAVEHKDLPIFGVQFHPESFLTPFGPSILSNFCKL